jgi:PAS domain S-box-containing protein
MGLEKIAGEQGFEVLFYGNPQPMWIFDIRTLRVLEVNAAAMKRYGYTREEFLTKTISDLRAQEDVDDLNEFLPLIRSGKTTQREFRHITKDGKVLYADIIAYSIMYQGIEARVVHARSMDENLELAGKLRVTQRRLLQILETTVIGFLQLDFNWTITYWNKAAEGLIGYECESVLGRNFWEVLPEIKHSDFQLNLQRTMTNRDNTDFVDYFWPVQKWFACNAYPAVDGIIVHLRDITTKKNVEESLLEKIDQLKEVSFLNSHAVRKPIASLLGLTNLVKQELIRPEEYKEVATLIHNCSLELDEVVKEVNNKVNEESNILPLKPLIEDFSFKDLLRSIISQAQTYSPKHRVLAEKLVDIAFYGNRYMIERAVKYLIINAIKYSPDADKVVLNSEIIKQNLVLSVQDFGKGITDECLNEIFLGLRKTSSSTTTSSSGLLNVSDVCRQHHGSMWIESQKGVGSTFMMRFPISNISMFKTTGRPDFSIYQNANVDITYNKTDNYIIVDWSGFHDVYTIKDAGSRILTTVIETQCFSILNNNLDLLGSWDDAINWVANDWFPLMRKAGLQHFAWILSLSTFSKLSAKHTISKIDADIAIKQFRNKRAALDWLLKIKAVAP